MALPLIIAALSSSLASGAGASALGGSLLGGTSALGGNPLMMEYFKQFMSSPSNPQFVKRREAPLGLMNQRSRSG